MLLSKISLTMRYFTASGYLRSCLTLYLLSGVSLAYSITNQKEKDLTTTSPSYRYEVLDIKGMKYLALHPFELEAETVHILEILTGIFFAEYLLLQDLKSIQDPEEYPYLDDVIYSPKPACVRENSYHFRLLQFKNYSLVGLGVFLTSFLGNSRLFIAMISLLLSWLLFDIAQVSGVHYIITTIIAIIPLLVASWFIFYLEKNERYKEKVNKMKVWVKKKRYWLAGGAMLFLVLNYFVITFLRVHIRVQEHHKRKENAHAQGKESEDRVIGLKERINDFNKKVAILSQENERLKEVEQSTQKLIEERKKDIERQKVLLKNKEKTQEELRDLEFIVKKKKQERTTMSKKKQALDKAINTLHEGTSQQKEQLKKLKSKEKKLTQEIKKINEHITKLKNKKKKPFSHQSKVSILSKNSSISTGSEGPRKKHHKKTSIIASANPNPIINSEDQKLPLSTDE